MLENARDLLKGWARLARLAGEQLVWGGEGRKRLLLTLLRRRWSFSTRASTVDGIERSGWVTMSSETRWPSSQPGRQVTLQHVALER